MATYNNVLKLLFIHDFNRMNNIDEYLLLKIKLILTSSVIIGKTCQLTLDISWHFFCLGHCLIESLWRHYHGAIQISPASHLAYLLGKSLVGEEKMVSGGLGLAIYFFLSISSYLGLVFVQKLRKNSLVASYSSTIGKRTW